VNPAAFRREDLHDPWSRYLLVPPESPQQAQQAQQRRSDGMTDPEPSATHPQQAQHIRNNPQSPDQRKHPVVADVADVADLRQRGEGRTCTVCREPLDPVLAATDPTYTAHPDCEPGAGGPGRCAPDPQ
jgi:hypothetical protein